MDRKGVREAPWGMAPWFQPIGYAYVALGWWQVARAEVSGLEQATSAVTAPGLATLATLAGRFGGFLLETAFYHLFWKSRGRRLAFWRFFSVVVLASMSDLLAQAMSDFARRHPGHLAACLVPFAGLHLASGTIFHSEAAVRAAWGSVGLLTALRLTLTARGQAQAIGVRLRTTLIGTGAVWLATRIMILWTVDLLKGMSPLPGG
jgi:hypothetical protein